MTPSLYAANSRMESLKSNMKAELITPLVSSLELGWTHKRRKEHQHSAAAAALAALATLSWTWCTWKSSRASSWFWMWGRVWISFSVFIVRITPSALEEKTGTWTNISGLLHICACFFLFFFLFFFNLDLSGYKHQDFQKQLESPHVRIKKQASHSFDGTVCDLHQHNTAAHTHRDSESSSLKTTCRWWPAETQCAAVFVFPLSGCGVCHLPPLHLCEVHSCYPVRHGFLIQVAAVASDEGRHVVPWETESGRCSHSIPPLVDGPSFC